MSRFRTRVGEDLVRSAEHRRQVHPSPRTREHESILASITRICSFVPVCGVRV